MAYNADMADPKRKFALWLSKEQAERFQAVFLRAKAKDGRTNYSEVIKELMGFPPDEGIRPVTTDADRQYLSGDGRLTRKHGSFLRDPRLHKDKASSE